MTPLSPSRKSFLKAFRLSDLSNRAVLLLLIGFALMSSLSSLAINLLTGEADFFPWAESWLQNFSTEMFGAFLTFILIELIVGGREKRAEREATRLEQQAAAISSLRAAQTLEERQAILDRMKLTDLLHGADFTGLNLQRARLDGANLTEAILNNVVLTQAVLRRANLTGASLQGAYLIGTNLRSANLSQADLQRANLDSADLYEANLSGCNLWGVNFQRASLVQTDLRGANLRWGANFRETDLRGANLRDVALGYAIFAESTLLPDETAWTNDTNMERFTSSRHPQFWSVRRSSFAIR